MPESPDQSENYTGAGESHARSHSRQSKTAPADFFSGLYRSGDCDCDDDDSGQFVAEGRPRREEETMKDRDGKFDCSHEDDGEYVPSRSCFPLNSATKKRPHLRRAVFLRRDAESDKRRSEDSQVEEQLTEHGQRDAC